MKKIALSILTMMFTVWGTAGAQTQPANGAVAKTSVVPNIVRFSGTAKDLNGAPLSGTVGMTFALYENQQGGAPLWLETQNVSPAKNGQYSVSLGATKPQGIPLDLFSSGQAQWLGVQIEGQSAQPRVLLLSVPYALKAADAETIGGLPPSAFVLATPSSSISEPTSSSTAGTTNSTTSAPPAGTVTGSGTTNFVPLWTSASNIGNSVLFQSGTGSSAKVGINTTAPGATLDIKGTANLQGLLTSAASGAATSTSGKPSQAHSFVASSFNSTTKNAVNQTFQWKAEPAANNTAAPSGTLNLLFGAGAAVPAETGVRVSNKGILTFAPGQTFPGAGTITGVAAGSGLTGGGNSGNVTLKLNTSTTDARYAQLAAVNAFSKNNSFAGTVGVGTTSPSGQLDVEAPATNPIGIVGATSSTAFFAAGILGHATGTSGETRGVYGVSDSPTGIGVHGIGSVGGQFETGTGTIFVGRGIGHTQVTIDASGNTTTSGGVSAGNGVFATTTTSSGTAVAGLASQGLGGLFFNDGPGPALAVQSDAFFASDSLLEGDSTFGGVTVPELLLDISGNLSIAGNISKAGGSFKIDHPLDPANKYLYHSFVESPDMMNIYNGVVVLNEAGGATVTLPDWFEALNRSFRYQLTAIGASGPNLYIAEEVTNNQFKIAGGKPGSKVSWQVTGVRHDAWADAHRIPVEVEKTGDQTGKYLHPELFGLARDKYGIQSKTAPARAVAVRK
jgi:trimeric autotransporter adhesin